MQQGRSQVVTDCAAALVPVNPVPDGATVSQTGQTGAFVADQSQQEAEKYPAVSFFRRTVWLFFFFVFFLKNNRKAFQERISGIFPLCLKSSWDKKKLKSLLNSFGSHPLRYCAPI